MRLYKLQGILASAVVLAKKLETDVTASVTDYLRQNGVNANIGMTADYLIARGVSLEDKQPYDKWCEYLTDCRKEYNWQYIAEEIMLTKRPREVVIKTLADILQDTYNAGCDDTNED